VILGHEYTGTIHDLGEGVKNDFIGNPVEVGDKVVNCTIAYCENCYICNVKRTPTMCPNTKQLSRFTCDKPPHLFGGFAEYIYLPPGFAFFKAPEGVPDEALATANCALGTIVHSYEKVGLEIGDSVVIQGVGGLGLYGAALAKRIGASKVIAIDQVQDRLKFSEEFGADHTINMLEYRTPEEREKKVKELTGGWGADLVVDVSGTPKAIPEGVKMLRKGGRYLEIGCVFPNALFQMDAILFPYSEITMTGVRLYEPRHLWKGLKFLEETKDKYPYKKLVSHKFKLEEINKAFELFDQRKVLRPGIIPG
jgi:threonine dehydrogenase-like Zn-dependent dehydrogenase